MQHEVDDPALRDWRTVLAVLKSVNASMESGTQTDLADLMMAAHPSFEAVYGEDSDMANSLRALAKAHDQVAAAQNSLMVAFMCTDREVPA